LIENLHQYAMQAPLLAWRQPRLFTCPLESTAIGSQFRPGVLACFVAKNRILNGRQVSIRRLENAGFDAVIPSELAIHTEFVDILVDGAARAGSSGCALAVESNFHS
jgi:hypothetical protein